MNPEWTDGMIEDYLNLLDNFITLAGLLDSEIDRSTGVTRITVNTTILPENGTIYADTDIGDLTVTLIGEKGESHRIINVGSSGNICTLTSVNKINGFTDDEILYDSENLDLQYQIDEGWF